MATNISLNTRLWRGILPAVVAVGLLASAWGLADARIGADCTNPNAPGTVSTDTTLSGALYADSDITVVSGAVLTLTAGTQLTMCGEYDLRVHTFGGSSFMALGTASQPVVIQAADPNTNWGRLFYEANAGPVMTSTLQHLQLIDGGGNDPAAESGALHIIANWAATPDANPVVDHLTVIDSGAYGVYAQIREDDPTPMVMTNITVTGSASYPMRLSAAAVGGLGQGNTLTGNFTDTIEVYTGGIGGSVGRSQTWLSQPVPYQITHPTNGGMNVGGSENPILTVGPGTTILMPPDGIIRMNSGGLIAVGTPTEPITFTQSGGGLWEGISFELNVDPSSRLSYASLLGTGGGSGQFGSLSIVDSDLELEVDHLNISGNPNSAGIYSRSPFLTVYDSRIENNKVGVNFDVSDGLLRGNIIQGNSGGGVIVSFNVNFCVDAIGNYWGSPDGPFDGSNALDACGRTTTNAGGGNAVSDDVLYEPWLPGEVNYWVHLPIAAKP